MSYVLMTDSGSDLPHAYYGENDITMLSIYFSLGDKTVPDDAGQSMAYEEFYRIMRGGAMPTTSMITPEDYTRTFEPVLASARDILYIAFSSGLSGSCQGAFMAAEELAKKYPDRRAVVIDSLCASLGQGLLMDYVVRLVREGRSLDEVHAWVEENKMQFNHLVTVDDLMHLHRGGRVSRASAMMGTLIGIKPMIYVNHEGKLIVDSKKRGRRHALDRLVEWMGEYVGGTEFDTIAVSHSDCEADAQYVADRVCERYRVGRVIINHIGAVIGSHTGPGTVALFFLGKTRQR
ncbi:MAG: DegV family protein [Oscillospiraceae bacterium]|jgi:DegV family protein with EDD domain|nr:DegV family protein [Oscillospiraceae bacterium]